MKGTQGFPFKVTGYPKRENRGKMRERRNSRGMDLGSNPAHMDEC